MDSKELSGTGRQRRLAADAATATVVLLLGAFLAWSGARLAERLHSSAARRQSLTFEDHLGIAANTTGLIVVVWWALSFSFAVVAAVLERGGSPGAAAAAGKFSPAFMRRLALAALGLQLVTAPLAQATTGPAGSDPAPAPAVAAAWTPAVAAAKGGATASGPAVPSPVPAPVAAPVAAPAPAPAPEPAVPRSQSRTPGIDPQWTPTPPAAHPRALAPAPRRTPEPAAGTAQVTVRAGDSLWSICARELGPLASDVDIALAWPGLYRANRGVIGNNPGLLLPGQVLHMPTRP